MKNKTESISREGVTKEKKTRIYSIILLVLSILTTAFIFSNSLKNGEESNAQSAPIVEVVEAVLDPEDKVPTKTVSYIVRKAAHITEYTVLGLLLCSLLLCVNALKKLRAVSFKEYKPIITVLLIGLAIASVDEIIQSFTGRTNSITDVIIDLVGVCLGVGIVIMIRWFLV